MRILLDVTRTLVHRHNPTPTGIDRVEHAFIRRLIERQDEVDTHFVLMTPYGIGTISPPAMGRMLRRIESNWQAEIGGERTVIAKMREFLETPVNPRALQIGRVSGQARRMPISGAYLDVFGRSLRGRLNFARLVREAANRPSLYLHTSHVQLDQNRLFRWTKAPGIQAAFLLHDLIPIDYPEFCGAGAVAKHHLRMNTVASLGKAIVVNSEYTGARVASYLQEFALPAMPVVVSRLGVQPNEWVTKRYASPRAAVPYFVHIGTIEGRKNIPFLLNVWRRMIATRGKEATPRLVLAGRRGWRCENVFAALDLSRELAGNVVEMTDLRDGELGALVRGAAGVLAPSLVEGYGLPPAEAVSSGIPVIASDIDAHREILGDHAQLLDPTDGIGWYEAIVALAFDEEAGRQARARTAGFPNVSWERHVDDALSGLLDIFAAPRIERQRKTA